MNEIIESLVKGAANMGRDERALWESPDIDENRITELKQVFAESAETNYSSGHRRFSNAKIDGEPVILVRAHYEAMYRSGVVASGFKIYEKGRFVSENRVGTYGDGIFGNCGFVCELKDGRALHLVRRFSKYATRREFANLAEAKEFVVKEYIEHIGSEDKAYIGHELKALNDVRAEDVFLKNFQKALKNLAPNVKLSATDYYNVFAQEEVLSAKICLLKRMSDAKKAIEEVPREIARISIPGITETYHVVMGEVYAQAQENVAAVIAELDEKLVTFTKKVHPSKTVEEAAAIIKRINAKPTKAIQGEIATNVTVPSGGVVPRTTNQCHTEYVFGSVPSGAVIPAQTKPGQLPT